MSLPEPIADLVRVLAEAAFREMQSSGSVAAPSKANPTKEGAK